MSVKAATVTVYEISKSKDKFDFDTCEYSDEYWGSVRLLVNKFIKKYKSIIPICLDKNDFFQEAWLAKNGYIKRYPWQACLRLMEKYSLYSTDELKEWKKTKELPYRQNVNIGKTGKEQMPNNPIESFIECQHIFYMLDQTGVGNFRNVFMAYYAGAETPEIAKDLGFGEDRTRHIRSEGLKILQEKLNSEEDYARS